MLVTYDNTNRERYYGKRKGDRIRYYGLTGQPEEGVVTGYGHGDNNAIYVQFDSKTESEKVVAEWCQIIKRVDVQ